MSDAKIKQLDSITAVRTRKELFIGSTNNTFGLISELLDNAKDEILAGYCKQLDVLKITNDDGTWQCVRDYGRGIPLVAEDGSDAIVMIATNLYSGGKFDNGEDGGYLFSSGLHGIGTTAVNALSKRLTITTLAHDAGNNHWQYFFKDGKFITKQLVHLTSKNDVPVYSTEVKFIPDEQYFTSTDWDEARINRVLTIAKYVFGKDVKITLNGVLIEDTYLEQFSENTLQVVSGMYTSKSTKEECRLDIALYDDFDSGKIFKGIVNTIECNEGTHKNVVQNLLKNKLVNLAEKNKKTIQPNDVFVPIKVNCILRLIETGFEEQVKSTLAVDKDPIVNLVEPLLDDMFKKNKDFFMKVIEKSEEYRINLESNKQARKGKNGKSVKCEGLYECISKNPEERSLYIVEGDSAGGSIVAARRPKYDAVLPLMGKLLNVVGTDKKLVSKAEIVKNKVIATLATALGYKIFGDIDPKKCRYKNIFLVADADPD